MKYMCWLQSLPGFGAASAAKMLEAGCHAQDLYKAGRRELESMDFLKKGMAEKILEHQSALSPEEVLEGLEQKGVRFTCLELAGYPEKLREIPNPPYGIYYYGSLPDSRCFTVAIVGARACSDYGIAAAAKAAGELSAAGVQVVSGLARGVDSAAQRSASDKGLPAWAVLGSGPDICYPKENYPLYQKICRNGGVLSEFPPGTKPRPAFFPMRNRIISGISDCTVVVEARKDSGSLITAACAREQGRDVYAIPGQMGSPLSEGCHSLIHDGAGIYYSTEEFLKDQSVFFAVPRQEALFASVKF